MYEPDHPLANDEGYVFKPNVNVVEEMAIAAGVLLHSQFFSGPRELTMCRSPEGWTPEKTRGFILIRGKYLS